jgi:hypothetical protein
VRSFFGRSLEYAAARGKRRPMVIGFAMEEKHFWPPWAEACEVHGMEPPARWHLLSAPLAPAQAPRNITQLLMHLPDDRRPDVLVIADDHLVTEVTAGLLATNLPEAQLPLVIAYANYPQMQRALVPVTYLGFDSLQIIRACIDALDAQRRGQAPASRIQVPAIFEFERASDSIINEQHQPLAIQEGQFLLPDNSQRPTRAEMDGHHDPD